MGTDPFCIVLKMIQKGSVPNCTILSLLEKRYNPKQYNSTDNCCYKRADNGSAPANANPTQDITAQKTTYYTNQQIDPETKTATLHNLASQKTSQATDKNRNNKTHN